MPLLSEAVDYSIDGWPVIPVKGKIPVTDHGSKDWTIDAGIIGGLSWPGIGLCTGHLFFVVDLDGPKGLGCWEKLTDGMKLDPTPMVKTRRGIHIYYLMPKKKIVPNKAGLWPGIDIRGKGGYVVAPPSPLVGATGKYEWITSYRDVDLADCPRFLYRKIFPQRKAKSPQRAPAADSPIDIEKLPVVVSGTRNSTLHKYALAAAGKGKTEDEVYREIEWINQHRCDTTLPDREIATIVRSACSYAGR